MAEFVGEADGCSLRVRFLAADVRGEERRERGFPAGCAFFVSRAMVILSWNFFAAAAVSHAFSWRLPSAPVQRAKYFPYLFLMW